MRKFTERCTSHSQNVARFSSDISFIANVVICMTYRLARNSVDGEQRLVHVGLHEVGDAAAVVNVSSAGRTARHTAGTARRGYSFQQSDAAAMALITNNE